MVSPCSTGRQLPWMLQPRSPLPDSAEIQKKRRYQKPTNSKLIDRACRIIQATTNVSIEKALDTLKETNNDVGLAIIMLKNNQSLNQAKNLLSATDGNVAEVLNKKLAN